MAGSADRSEQTQNLDANRPDATLPRGTDAAGTPELPQESAQARVAALSAQVSAMVADATLPELKACLERLRAGVTALTPSALTRRRGLAGLFDSRSRRLKALRAAYRTAAIHTSELADTLDRSATRLAERHEAMSALAAELRDAVLALDPLGASPTAAPSSAAQAIAVTGIEAAIAALRLSDADGPDLPATGPMGSRTVVLGRLATLRATRNAEHRVPADLAKARDGVLAWQTEWEHELGLTTRRPHNRWPNAARLAAARTSVLHTLDRAEQSLEAAIERNMEVAQRAPGPAGSPTHLPGPTARTAKLGEDGTASQA